MRRNEQSYDPSASMINEERQQVRGPQKIGDLEEVFEDSSNSPNESESDDDDVN